MSVRRLDKKPYRLKLPDSFYLQETSNIAKALLGKVLVHVYRGQRLSGMIVETEAYLGAKDQACHSRNFHKSERILSMYKNGGHAYVYFIYGMYWCMNVVTRPEGVPEAVLIRALNPIEGIKTMQRARSTSKLHNLTSGPGKLCEALHINNRLDGIKLTGNRLFIEDLGYHFDEHEISVSKRIGISNQNPSSKSPLRFYLKHDPFVSGKKHPTK